MALGRDQFRGNALRLGCVQVRIIVPSAISSDSISFSNLGQFSVSQRANSVR